MALLVAGTAHAQQGPLPAEPTPPVQRPREVLKLAIDCYKRGEYEAAAGLFVQIQARQAELSATEKQDLSSYAGANSSALRGRQEGNVLLQRADEAVRQGRMAEATPLLKAANANQYLSAPDRQHLAELSRQMQVTVPASTKADPRALLSEARDALKRGDLDGAEGLARQAEQAGSGASAWLKPWEDSPAKVRREVQSMRQQLGAPPRQVEPANESSGLLSGAKALFSRTEKQPDNGQRPADPVAPRRPGEDSIVQVSAQMPAEGPPNDAAGAARAQARQLLRIGYHALEVNDLERARRFAMQARELHAELSPNELSPDQLLTEIQRRSNASAPVIVGPKADSRALVREARQLMQKEQFDEAERLISLAEATPGTSWRLFEDTPGTVRRELIQARARHDRTESVKVLAEARQLFSLGDLEQAKRKAWRAQQLHGPYGALDFGDRPQRLLDEIQRAEAKQVQRIPGKENTQVAQQAPKRPTAGVPNPAALVSATAQSEAHNRAAQLVHEARILEQQGKLLDALQKANEARQMPVAFAPEEDSPGAVWQSLAGRCNQQVQGLLQQASDKVVNSGGDPGRLQTALLDLQHARQLTVAFGQDAQQVDQKVLWLHQLAAANGIDPASLAAPSGPNADGPHQAQAVDPELQRRRQAGMEKLDKSRLEVRNGNYVLARKLAEEALNASYGVQGEAEAVLRSIYAEEHNQNLLAARRSFEAAVDAFSQGNYPKAMSIIATFDPQSLPPDSQARLREIMGTREMQPGFAQAQHKEPAAPSKEMPGKARVGDNGPDYLDTVRVMEEVQFQQLYERGLQTRRTAMEHFKAGEMKRAIDTLGEYLKQLGEVQLDADRLAKLRRPVENLQQQYRTVEAQALLQSEKSQKRSPAAQEAKREMAKEKSQQEIVDLMKQYAQLMKEGKEAEAWVLATKASELDPENPAVRAAVEIAKMKDRQKRWDKNRDSVERWNQQELDNDLGDLPTTRDPVVMSKEAAQRYSKLHRGSDKGGIWQQRSPMERAIEYKLNEPITLNFKDTPLKDVIADLRSLSNINIVPNDRALSEAGINLEQRLDLSVNNIPLKSALNHLLDKVKLTYAIKENVLSITTQDDGKGKLRTVVYPVADLVVPVENQIPADITNLEKTLTNLSQAGRNGLSGYTPSPITGPLALSQGQPVSSYSSGLGAAAAAPQGTERGPRMPGHTIEEQLMTLIKNTVAKNSWEELGGQGSVQYFPLGMALVVNQTQEVQEDIRDLLAALRRLQDLEVSIEMRLISVSEAFFEFMGVNFDVNINTPTSRRELDLVNSAFVQQPFVNRNLSNLNTITGLTPAGTLTPDLNIPIKNTSFGFATPPFGGYPGTFGADGGVSLGLAFLSEIQVFMFMEAAQGDRRTQIMQAPKITVFNGQTAFINVTQSQFFLTGVNLFSVNGQIVFAPNNTPIQYGVAMTVTPVVSADRRFVRLNLAPALTNLTNATVPLIPVQIPVPQIVQGPGLGVTTVGQPVIFQMFFQQPSFQTITLSTTVNVPDGGTVLLGGLKTMSEGRNEFGPPILSKIPYVSRLFKNVGYGREAQSLMIMVTPRIIINEEEERVFLGLDAPIPRP
jgi:type II secretory pathway component GspD/PulD (secretin)